MALWLAGLLLLPVSGEAIVKRNVFCSGCVSGERAPPVASRLPLELVAIMRTPDGADSAAVIVSVRDREVGLYRLHARVAGAEVAAIGARQVLMRVGERFERLELDRRAEPERSGEPPRTGPQRVDGSDGIRCLEGRCELERGLLRRLLADPGAMASWARVMPAARGGLVLQVVRRGTPLAALGFESGDRLHALNGITLGGVEQMLQLYVQLKNATRVAVTVERRGAQRTFDLVVR